MPKFVEQIIEDYFWSEARYNEVLLNVIAFEIPDYSLDSDEEEIRIEDDFVPDNIETM